MSPTRAVPMAGHGAATPHRISVSPQIRDGHRLRDGSAWHTLPRATRRSPTGQSLPPPSGVALAPLPWQAGRRL